MFKYNVDTVKEIKRDLRRKKEICERYFNHSINSLTDFYQMGLYIGQMIDIVNSYYVANIISYREKEKFTCWIMSIYDFYYQKIQDSFHSDYLVKKD